MSGQGSTRDNAPLNTRPAVERSYGGTFATDRVSTSHLASSSDIWTQNVHHFDGRDDGGSLHLPDNVPQLQRQDSSRTVRMNAVEDGAGALRRGVKFFTFSLVDMFLIVIGTVVLGLHWGDKPVACHSSSGTDDDSSINDGWRQWALVAVVLKVVITCVCVVRWKLEEPSEHQEANARAIKGVLDFLNFIQYVWSFSGLQMLLSSRSYCDNRSDSPIYQLCLVFMVVFFVPIVMVMLLALALCFCLPSVLGALQRMSLRRSGARQEEIDRLPVVKFNQHELVEESCAICLVDYDDDDDLRKLPCGHALHQPCVDNWLAVNPSCPICRAPCITAREGEIDSVV